MKNGLFIIAFFLGISSFSQNSKIKIFLKKDSTAYLQFNGLGQIWVRYNQSNPGTLVYDTPKDNTFDIGLRRWRFSLQGKVTKKISYYTQFGQNNFNYLSNKYTGAFFHDAFMEYELNENKLIIGGGLSGWNGLSRYASPSIGSLMSLDAPLYQQITNGINDQFLRKLSIHAKGIIKKLNYRIALTTPMAIQTSPNYKPAIAKDVSSFSENAPKLQYQGYFMYHFKEIETNITPYTTGTYLGEKSVVNLGAGIIYQPGAMWTLNEDSDTVSHKMLAVGTDFFLDEPLNEKTVLTIYSAYHYFDFGENYIKNIGVMNPANGTNNPNVLNGGGNAYPALGTGHSFYTQVGYLFRNLNDKHAGLMPYLAAHFGDYDGLDELMTTYNLGVNYLFQGSHGSKLSLELQNRPIFFEQSNRRTKVDTRMNMVVLQMQLAF
jgi:hypothetical protein